MYDKVSIVLAAVFFSTHASLPAHVQNPAAAEQTSHRVNIDGAEHPDLIPSFYAWRLFFEVVDNFYRAGALKSYMVNNMELEEIAAADPVTARAAWRVLADTATLARRDQERISSLMVFSGKKLERNLIDQTEDRAYRVQCYRDQVELLRRSKASLRARLSELPQGAAIWEKISAYVERGVKSNMSYSSDGTADDAELLAIIREFETPVDLPLRKGKHPQ